jgi:protein TonB
MNADKILTAQLDDIIFDNRNKSYGAYFLRRIYESHIIKALIIAVVLGVLTIGGFRVSAMFKEIMKKDKPTAVEVQLEEPPPLNPNEPPPPPPPPPIEPPPPPVATVKFVPPVVKKDEEVKDEEPPATKEEIKEAVISTKTQEGVKNAPEPVEEKAPPPPVVEQPKPKEPEIFTVVEQNPEFPDGQAALMKYLAANIKYPTLARENNISGKVILQFVVDEDGGISDIKAARGIGGGCDEEAIRVVKSMPKWKPGKQRGRPVKVRFTLPVSFKLE